MKIRIRDWSAHFEQDRSRQWKHIKWVPIPNKQGAGYRKIMSEKNGLELFACWIALVQVASLCDPRGDLSKYTLEDLSRLTLCDIKKLDIAISYLSQELDWIEVIENLDKNVKDVDISVSQSASGSSILFNSIQSNTNKKTPINIIPPKIDEVKEYFIKNGYPETMALRFFNGYDAAGWRDSKGNPVRSWKQKAHHVWFKEENKNKQPPEPTIDTFYGKL